ncbi:MAG: helix-hairpin-helix domain-containing protein, partial [Gammaproteobacteria bacterium]
TQAIASEEQVGDTEPAEDLLNLTGMDKAVAYRLAGRGIVTMEDLADQAVDDIKDVEGLDEVKAGELIMAARAPWFASEEMQQK